MKHNRLNIFTIVLDGMPFIAHHYNTFRKLPLDWTWTVVEGVAAPTNCTFWCKRIDPRLSNDGTTEYLDSLSFDPRVRVLRSHLWDGKIEMVNAALRSMNADGILLEVDSDELWTVEQLVKINQVFNENPKINTLRFFCDYYLGRDIVINSKEGWTNGGCDWFRAWRYEYGMLFKTHEPPVIEGMTPKVMDRESTKLEGLVFDHFSFALEKQVRFKEHYYGYTGAVDNWKKLQMNQKWPVLVRDFLPWSDDKATAIRIKQ